MASFDTLAYALRFSGPWIYDTNLDASSTSGNMSSLLGADTFYYDPLSVDLAMTSTGGLSIQLLAKTGNYGADMIDKVVSPALGDASMYSQSSSSTVVASAFSLIDAERCRAQRAAWASTSPTPELTCAPARSRKNRC